MRSVACLWLADKAAGRWPTGRVRQSHYETEGLTSYTVDPLADGISLLAKANDRSGDERPQARRHQRAPA